MEQVVFLSVSQARKYLGEMVDALEAWDGLRAHRILVEQVSELLVIVLPADFARHVSPLLQMRTIETYQVLYRFNQ